MRATHRRAPNPGLDMITSIKVIHTIIWSIMTMAVCQIGFSVVVMRFDSWFFVAMFLIVAESLVLAFNSWKCPLSDIARGYSDEKTPNFDIYLPKIIARYNKEIFSVVLVLILLLYVRNMLM